MNTIGQLLKTQAAMTQAAPQLDKLKGACQEMEAAFLKNVVSLMRKSAGEVHFGKELGGDMYRDMMDDNLAGVMAEKSSTGLATAMYRPMANQVLNQALVEQSRAVAKIATVHQSALRNDTGKPALMEEK